MIDNAVLLVLVVLMEISHRLISKNNEIYIICKKKKKKTNEAALASFSLSGSLTFLYTLPQTHMVPKIQLSTQVNWFTKLDDMTLRRNPGFSQKVDKVQPICETDSPRGECKTYVKGTHLIYSQVFCQFVSHSDSPEQGTWLGMPNLCFLLW